MSKKKTGGETSTDKALENVLGIGGDPGEFTITITTKYLSSLEKNGAVVNGKPVPHKEFIKKEGYDKLTSSERSYLYYLREKETIKEAYQESKDWDKVISSVVYVDIYESMEAFIDLVEEIYKTPVKDAKHLMKLTGCKDYEETEDVTLQETIYAGRYSKYYRTLVYAVEKGLKYNQLLKLKPKMYGLPETWTKRGREFTQYKAILNAIDEEFGIGEPNISLLPSLRLIAKELEAPYSVIMDAFKDVTHSRKKTNKDKIEKYKKELRNKFPEFIESKGKAWRKEWLLEDTELYDVAREDIEREYATSLLLVALKDVAGTDARCGEEIEQDIRTYFKEELEGLKEELTGIKKQTKVKQGNGGTGSKKEVYRAES